MTKFGKKRNAVRDSLVGKEKHNPFEVHINNTKFQILGQKSKDDRGIPGVSRTKAIKKRENSLLKEYKDRFKAGKFVDKRIGENDPFMEPERKMMLRMIAEKRHEFSKKNIFNLNDEVELTHKGESLTEATLNDRSTFSDEDDDDDMLNADYVKQQHFGGGFLTKKTLESEDKPKSRKEWIDEIIAESKRKKSETKRDKDEQEEAVSRLNSQYQNFMMHMSGNRMTDEDKEKSIKNCEFKSYDQIVKELLFDRTRRAQPTDKTKTEEEIAKEQKEKLEALEAARLRRMEINFDENAPKAMIQQSADALDDEVYFKKDARFHVSYNNGAMMQDIPVVHTSTSTNKNVIHSEEPSVISNDKLTESTPELPYTFEVPSDYDSFWNLIRGRSPREFSVILERMFSCNHPRLGMEKKNKCNTLFAYLLQTIHMICSVDPELIHENYNSLKYIDPMIPYMFKLTSLSPHDCALSLNQVIEEKYQDYQKNNKRYPYADTFIFLKISGMLFPASDYHHEVMTRVATILAQFLGESKVRNRREITCLLFTAALLHEYLKRCGRFIGELSNAVRGILYMCVPTDESKLLLTYTTPFQRVGPKADLLVLKDKVETYKPLKLTLSQLNEESDMTEEFKICAVHESIRILTGLTKTWAALPSARTLSSLTTKILVKFPRHNYPGETNLLVQQLVKQIEELPPHPRHLVKSQGAIKTLRMLEPKVEKIVEGFKKKRGLKEYQEKQKLMHKLKRERKGAKRELRRDAAFLGKEQLKETLRSDAERKRKVNLIMQGLSSQESDFKKMKNKKKFQ